MEPNEADNVPAAGKQPPVGSPRGCGKGSNKIVVAIWVTLLLGGLGWFNYSRMQNKVEGERLLNEAYMLYGRGDYASSTECLRQSAELGNPWAQLYYGERLKNGFYAEQNPVEAVKWLRKAARQGYPEAFYQLGICYENGEGVERDLNRAEAWYSKALNDPGFKYDAQASLDRIAKLKAPTETGAD